MALLHRKPEPLLPSRLRALCPVCGKPSYSRAGVHPQCAMLAADQAHARRTTVSPPQPAPQPHAHRCPRCQEIQSVRRRTCECGHVLPPPAGK